MGILILIFAALIGLGGWQIYEVRKQKAKTKKFLHMIDSQTQGKSAIEIRLLRYNFGAGLMESFRDFIIHLRGDNRETLIKHIIILVVVLCVIHYFNSTTLNLPALPFYTIVTMITCYFIYIMAKKKARIDFETSFAEALNIIGSAVSVGNG